MAIQVHDLSAQQLADTALRRQIGEVYREAFTTLNLSESAERLMEMLEIHRSREGFRCFVAQDEATQQVVGFIYGFTSRPGYWWFDTISRALSKHAIEIWFTDAYEVVEFAVAPQWHGLGIGGRLHDALMDSLPVDTYSTAVLSTYPGDTNAMQLYRKRGWVPLLQDFYFPGRIKPMVIMGLDLEAHARE